jgi:hypothetical protein
MLGERAPITQVPFFWSQHYDVPINYVGHAESWDEIMIDGDVMRKDCGDAPPDGDYGDAPPDGDYGDAPPPEGY